MKRIILFLAILSAVSAFAQEPYKVYAELLGYQKGIFSKKVTVRVDLGQEVSFWKQNDMKIVDENGKDVVFNSMVDAMNFMGKFGWSFVQAYVVSEGNQNVYHWLLSKEVTTDEQIKEGLNLKSDNNEKPEMKYVITYFRKPKKSTKWDKVNEEKYPDMPAEELNAIMDKWKNSESTMYDFDCNVSKLQ